MKKQVLAVTMACLAFAAQASTPVHVNGLGGWLTNMTFAYAAAPDGSSAALEFASGASGHAVIGSGLGVDVDGKAASLVVATTADMSSLATSVIGPNFYESFAAQGTVDITMLDGALGNLLSASISGGRVRVDVVTHQATVELDLTGLTSGSLYLTGRPATLTLEGTLAAAPILGNCADHAYKASCLPGEQFLGDFTLASYPQGAWKVSTDAFVSSVPEPGTAALLLLGAAALGRRAARRSATAG